MATETREPLPSIAPAAVPDQPVERVQTPARERPRLRGVTVVWLAATVGFALFLAFGSVTLESGRLAGRTMRVAEVWRRLGDALPEVGHATLLRVVFYGAIAVVLAGAVLGLWLALTATGEPAPLEPSSPPTERA